MRDIRFRAWDKVIKDWLQDYEFNIAPAGQVFYIDAEGDVESNIDAVLMQYTGLKDKNGKEIYEGDIVQHKKWANPKPYVVEWKELYLYEDGKGIGYELGYDIEHAEVIGNIYENGDLLND